MSISFDTIYERDRHTDTQTLHDGIGRTYAQHHVAKTTITQHHTHMYAHCNSSHFLGEPI